MPWESIKVPGYGVPYPVQISRTEFRESYKLAKPELLKYIEQFSVYMTQADAGIDSATEDILHYVELDSLTKVMYNKLLADRVLPIDATHTVVGDSIMALRTQLHQLEGGTIKCDDEYLQLATHPKIDYIKQTWGDVPGLGIMCYYKEELNLLKKHFKHAELYSSIRHAEGVDLSHLDTLVVYSFGFSGAKFIQFRDRCVNVNNKSHINHIHLLLVKDAISDQVYQVVKDKANFNDSTFKQKEL